MAEADLPLLCARHATSKLQRFEDLGSGRVSTYGFRGEALASISYVAHVTVTTAVPGAVHGLRARYRDGTLLGPPDPVATPGPGTTISVEDLFYNTPARRRGLAPPADEYARCVDVVARYAIGRAGVGLTVRKQGAVRPDVMTTTAAGAAGALPPPTAALTVDAARCVYGPALAKALVPFSFTSDTPWDGSEGGGGGGGGPALEAPAFRAAGLITAPSHSVRRPVFILFINGRSVEAGLLRRALEATHAALAPRGTKAWAFLSLELPPQHVDPNVHPTKREVAFLHGDAVAGALAASVEAALTRADASHTYRQALLPEGGVGVPRAPEGAPSQAPGAPAPSTTTAPATKRDKAGGDHKLVRTDARAQTLHRFVHVGGSIGGGGDVAAKAAAAAAVGAPPRVRGGGHGGGARPGALDLPPPPAPALARPAPPPPPGAPRPRPNPHPSTRLASVAALLAPIEAPGAAHPALGAALKGAVWVGPLDATRALWQAGTSLYLADLSLLSAALAYQQALRRVDAHGAGAVTLDPPLPLTALIELALRDEEAAAAPAPAASPAADPATASTADAAALAARLLTLKAGPLGDHFAIAITADGCLAGVPRVLDGLWPGEGRLPSLCLALARDVDWATEASFFEGAARALAAFNTFGPRRLPLPGAAGGGRGGAPPQPPASPGEAGFDGLAPPARAWLGQHVLLPALKAHLCPGRGLVGEGALVELSRLDRLYRVFERC